MHQLQKHKIKVDGFGFMPNDDRQIVRRYTMTNNNEATVRIISLGACVQSIIVPNSRDEPVDVVLGFDDVEGYLKNRYLGRIINRSSNPFGKIVQFNENNDDPGNMDIVNWDSCNLGDRVVMTRVSRIGNEGESAGHLMTRVTYIWTDDNQLHIEIRATSTKPTVVDIGSYCLFNLAGHETGPRELKKHVVTINTDKQATNDKIVDELRSSTLLSSRKLFRVPGGGYNHNFFIANPNDDWAYRFHARMLHPTSGRSLDVYSNHPSLQLYTGNHLPDPEAFDVTEFDDKEYEEHMIPKHPKGLTGKDGASYVRHGCFALVPQGYQETLCCRKSIANVLYPGKIYLHDITYDFGVRA